jgi:DNA-binding PadR family transcriptional regulator
MHSPTTDESQRHRIDPTVWGNLTGFKRDLLRTLAALDAPNGLELEAELKAAYPNITHARVYQNLDQLADQGLITKRSVDDRQNAYSLTDDGETQLEAAAERYTDALQDGEGS